MFERILVFCVALVCIAKPSFCWQAGNSGALPPPLNAHEFIQNSALLAHARQTVVFDAKSAGQGEDSARYELASGDHEFCLRGNQAYFTRFVVEDVAGKTVFKASANQRCTTATLPEGVYTLRLLQRSSTAPDSSETAYVQVDVPGPTLLNSNGGPAGGYWAIQPDPAIDPQQRPGRLRALLPLMDLGSDAKGGGHPSSAQVVADFSSQVMDETSLFRFPDPSADPYISALPLVRSGEDNCNGYLTVPCSPWWDDFATYPVNEQNQILLVATPSYFCCIDANLRLTVQDLGNYRFNLLLKPYPIGYSATYLSDHTLASGSGIPVASLRVMFRFFPDGTQIGDLQEGEAALFQEAGFMGKAVVFGLGKDQNLTDLNSAATTIDKTTQSVRLGNNTALFYTIPVEDGTETVPVMSDAKGPDDDRLSSGPITGQISIVSITSVLNDPLFDFLLNECPGCKLANTTLTGTSNSQLQFVSKNFSDAHFEHATVSYINFDAATLSGAHFDGARLNSIEFTSRTLLANTEFNSATLSNITFGGANLQHVNFLGATLSNVDMSASTIDNTTNFSGATLSCVSLHGTDSDHLLDLTQLPVNVKWVSNISCLSNLSYTKLSIKQTPPSTWKNFDLTGAVFVDLEDGQQLSSQSQPLDLTNAHLAGVKLQNVVLDYAVMTGADLQQTQFNLSSLQHVDLRHAHLQGATLDHANLDGAVLQGASLTKPASGGVAASFIGAFLRNVNLAQAQLGGVYFTNASFYSTTLGTGPCAYDQQTGITSNCSTAAGTTIDNAVFDSAFLFGVDFSNATGQGVDFSNAVVVGADFDKATLTGDPAAAQRPGFPGAFLEGTSLASAAVLTYLTLDGAYVDFNPNGNTLTLVLNNAHTAFPGYWNAPGTPVCAQMAYNNPSTVPARNSTMTCPNGTGSNSSHGCGPANPNGSNGNWNSDTPFPNNASYQNDSTYTKAPAQQVCQVDRCWSLGLCGTSRETSTHRARHGVPSR